MDSRDLPSDRVSIQYLAGVRPGVQRKHDKHDATQLARLHRAGELVAVRIPSEAEQRVRDVVRCRETFQREILKSRHFGLVGKGVFAKWEDPREFEKVYIDKEMGTVAWPGDLDLAPDGLYREVDSVAGHQTRSRGMPIG
ncbi:MAG: DUF2442 domain-containing protein [Gemmatimonadaceae bacterium]